MNARRERKIEFPRQRCPAWRMAFVCGLLVLPGCSLVVMQADYEKDKRQNQRAVDSIRSQLLAHTQILANHGNSLNEFKLQLRDAVSNVQKTMKELKANSRQTAESPKQVRKQESAWKPADRSETHAATRYIRRTYQGLSLSYAGGYDEPRGSRYPYRLEPGTRVAVVSGERRGFTKVEVRTGRWLGKKMWVRTRWLVKPPHRKDGKS